MKRILPLFLIILLSSFIYTYALKANIQYNELDDKVNFLMQKYNVPGTAIAVVKNNEIEYTKGFGFADKNSGDKIDENTIFQIASISKTITTWGVMNLVEEGKLDLDVSVGKYLTRWSFKESDYLNEVTIRRILSHTAGLSVPSYSGYNPDSLLPTIEESLSGFNGNKGLEIIGEPGEKYKYSGGGYTLLQLIIEEVTGKDFSLYMQQEILEPLGMDSSSFEWNDEIKQKAAKTYGIFGQEIPTYIYTEKAAAGFNTTVKDLALFAIAEMNDSNNVLDNESIELMHTPVAEMKKENVFYGLGHIITRLSDDTKLVYHLGDNRGWHALFMLIPEKEEGYILLTNGDTGIPFYKSMFDYFIKTATNSTTRLYSNVILGERITLLIIVLLFILILFKLINDLKLLYSNKRMLCIKQNKSISKPIIITILIISILIILFVSLYTGIVYHGWVLASFLPHKIIWVYNELVVLGLTLCLSAFFPKLKSNK